MTPNELRKEVKLLLLKKLQSRGFELQNDILIRERNKLIFDWIAWLTWISRPNGPIGIALEIGVHYVPVMEIEAKIYDSKYLPRYATFQTNLGYISKYKRYIEWNFNREKFEKKYVKNMLKLIHKYGIPFQESFNDIQSIQQGIDKYTLPIYKQKRNAIIEYLKGNKAVASHILEQELTKTFRNKDGDPYPMIDNLRKIFNSDDMYNYYNKNFELQ